MTLHDRTAVITGAGNGIGRAIAQSLGVAAISRSPTSTSRD
jgi:NAD(P)-dependent dehydrogenase (short-subunit alcohol dehydrogenase family)